MITSQMYNNHHHYKGNISLMMLFVLAIGSLIGLMSTGFIQDMISSTIQVRDFYQSYYIAKGGIELWTLAINRYEYGLQDHITGANAIISSNLNCKKDCNLDLTIQSRINQWNNERRSSDSMLINADLEVVNQCNVFTENKFELSPGQSYVVPLFADQRKLTSNNNTIVNVLADNPKYNMSIRSPESYQTIPLGIGIVLGSSNQAIYDTLSLTGKQKLFISWSLSNFSSDSSSLSNDFNIYRFLHASSPLDDTSNTSVTAISSQYSAHPIVGDTTKDYFNYLYITNLSKDTTFPYCLSISNSENGFISDRSIITSISTYWDTTLWLQAQARKPLLEYIIRPYTE